MPSSINACRVITVDHYDGAWRCSWALRHCQALQEQLGGWPGINCAANLGIEALGAVRQDQGYLGTALRASLCAVRQQMTQGQTVVGRKGLQTLWQVLLAAELPAFTLKASPMPSHTGRWKRVCVQAKIQGMARSVSRPVRALRLAGLQSAEPC